MTWQRSSETKLDSHKVNGNGEVDVDYKVGFRCVVTCPSPFFSNAMPPIKTKKKLVNQAKPLVLKEVAAKPYARKAATGKRTLGNKGLPSTTAAQPAPASVMSTGMSPLITTIHF